MKDQIKSLPGLRELNGVHYSGYASVNKKNCKTGDESLFYWFAGREDYADRPTILWTNGGPGSSSFWGLFLENGPFEISSGFNWNPPQPGSVTERPKAWNESANFLIFEHPLSVTLSAANDPANIPTSVGSGIEQLYEALQSFLDAHPEVRKQEILIAGESYGGTYVPLLSDAILQGNKNGRSNIKLKGQVITSGWVNPRIQQGQDGAYAFAHGLIDENQKAQVDKLYQALITAMDKETPPYSAKIGAMGSKIENYIRQVSGRNYLTNILKDEGPSSQLVLDYINDPVVRKAIHAKESVPQVEHLFSNVIYSSYQKGEQDSVAPLLQKLVQKDGLQTMITSGLDDGSDVNFLGVQAYINELKGSIFDEFRATEAQPWLSPYRKAPIGSFKKGGHFSWLKVAAAGHMSVRDQPLMIDKIMEEFFPNY